MNKKTYLCFQFMDCSVDASQDLLKPVTIYTK